MMHRPERGSRVAPDLETRIGRRLRAVPGLIPCATFAVGAGLYWALGWLMGQFALGRYWVAFPAGLIVHAFMIVLVHDGAHRAITRTRADRAIMNAAAGLVLLPFWAEPFRHVHLVHHAHTNQDVDPRWPPVRAAVL